MQGPIVAGREPTATEAEVTRGTECSNQLSATVNAFILRRTNALLSAHLPPKVWMPHLSLLHVQTASGTRSLLFSAETSLTALTAHVNVNQAAG